MYKKTLDFYFLLNKKKMEYDLSLIIIIKLDYPGITDIHLKKNLIL